MIKHLEDMISGGRESRRGQARGSLTTPTDVRHLCPPGPLLCLPFSGLFHFPKFILNPQGPSSGSKEVGAPRSTLGSPKDRNQAPPSGSRAASVPHQPGVLCLSPPSAVSTLRSGGAAQVPLQAVFTVILNPPFPSTWPSGHHQCPRLQSRTPLLLSCTQTP